LQEVVSSELVNSQFFVVDCRKGAKAAKFVVLFPNPLKASRQKNAFTFFLNLHKGLASCRRTLPRPPRKLQALPK
jgi:hypothetical protein